MQGPALPMVAVARWLVAMVLWLVAVAHWLGGVWPPIWALGTCLQGRVWRWEPVKMCVLGGEVLQGAELASELSGKKLNSESTSPPRPAQEFTRAGYDVRADFPPELPAWDGDSARGGLGRVCLSGSCLVSHFLGLVTG